MATETLGLCIKKNRILNRLKVYELADKAKVTPEFITQIEKGRRFPSEEVLERIMKTLKIDLKPIYYKERHPDIVVFMDTNVLIVEAKKIKK